MPVDLYEDEDPKDAAKEKSGGVRFKEFECATCSANNPCDPAAGEGDEVMCHYCGSEFDVHVSDSGRLKLKER